MTINNVLLVGGSGFVGRHLIAALCRGDVRITVAARRRERARHLLPFPAVEVVDADVHDDATLARLVAGQDVVINLVGVIKGGTGRTDGKPWGAGFERAHVRLAGRVAGAARAAGVRRLLHMSALQAAADAPSAYLRSKAAGEAAVREAFPAATVFRPSVIFGQGDSFLTLFAGIAALAPVLPLACADARFQPVWVEDVAAVMAAALAHPESAGQSYELCGPTVYSLHELVDCAARVAGTRANILPLGDTLSWLQAWLMEFVPGGPMTRDNYWSMQLPSTCAVDCALPFGRRAAALETIAPTYLADGRRRAGFDDFREAAKR
jgi:NADH dehydrogenase